MKLRSIPRDIFVESLAVVLTVPMAVLKLTTDDIGQKLLGVLFLSGTIVVAVQLVPKLRRWLKQRNKKA